MGSGRLSPRVYGFIICYFLLQLKQFQSQNQADVGLDPTTSQDGSISDHPSERSTNNNSGSEENSTSQDSKKLPEIQPPPITSLFDLLSAQIEKPLDKFLKPHTVEASPPASTPQTVDPVSSTSQTELDVERQRNHELSIQLLNQNTQIEQLRSQVQRLNIENSTKVTMEIGPLQQQLQSHVQTIGVLVGEKAELAAGLAKFQSLARQKIAEVEELQGRLNASRHRVQVLERDVSSAKTSSDRIEETQQKLCSELETGQEQLKQKQRQIEEITEECSELRRSLTMRANETDTLNKQLNDTRSLLSLAQLRVEQLTAGDGVHLDDSKIEQLAQQKIASERQVTELQHIVSQLGAERDQANQQYQNYVQTLNKEIGNLAQQLQSYVADNERLSQREESLVRHVGELERQMQQQMAKQKNFQKSHKEANLEQHPDHAVWSSRFEELEKEKAKLNVRNPFLVCFICINNFFFNSRNHFKPKSRNLLA